MRKTPALPEDRGPSAEDDARALAVEVLRDGRVSQAALRDRLGWVHSRLLRAVAVAHRAGWVEGNARGLKPGAVIPDGKLPTPVRAAMLARFVRERGTVERVEAAEAIGLAPGGSFPRVLQHAVEQGDVRTVGGSRGGIEAAA